MDVPGLAHWGVAAADATPTSELVVKAQVRRRRRRRPQPPPAGRSPQPAGSQ